MALKIAVLASGNGSNLQAILDRHAGGVLDVDIRLVLCNRANAHALERAKAAGVQTLCRPHVDFPDRESFDLAMIEAIREAGADTIVLAGYMRLLTPTFLQAFAGRVINIHPAILPAFAGVRGAADAHAYGVKLTGCTVHFVDEIMDHGPVIVQAAVPVNPEEDVETLKQRIHSMEHRIYPQALQWLAEGRLVLDGRVVRLAPSDRKRAVTGGDWLIWPPLEEGF
ncbi:phosphoribosylglycinamide formyltransferase [Desulfovibrio subterraneus]|uniref:phosphoribosylglycinamide formyltransferase n=1 Tax=Desulfovibrio subterraneus TaxID=2718620 RepID=UPI0022B888CD|nr:phosphoribosylglycinamide formyltransferase [Desulfovibrio subterraneus]WBF67032.1 phosphoribosylglycinamide formyltransferase [Desulfovibrio subterraneus]